MTRADALGLILLAATLTTLGVLWVGDRALRRTQRDWDAHVDRALELACCPRCHGTRHAAEDCPLWEETTR